ncbi:MAG: hypothetical protein JKY65_30995 [Planctomycetes bacterium]|nr:hypothetical protein [Planctomycetota bacterium]
MARYSVSDLFYWFGFALGAGVGYRGALQLDVSNRWVSMGISLAVGVGVGFLVERLHRGPKQPPMEGP